MKITLPLRVASFQPVAVLEVSGEDAFSFLQGQFTQDLKGPERGAWRYGLWLNQKGKVVADSFVFRLTERVFRVVSYESPAAVIRERLEAYIIADDVTIEDQTAHWTGFTIFGPSVREWWSAQGVAFSPGQSFGEWQEGLVWPGRRAGGAGWDWLVPSFKAASVAWSAESLAAPDEMERLRIQAGVPSVPRDVGPADLPNEAGLEREAISYTKGCYLGQEVMARLKTMGRVRRRLVRVRGEGVLPPALPLPVFWGDKRVGEIRSSAAAGDGWVGLAMLSAPEAGRLRLAPEGPDVIAVEALAS
jgi:tRNA-modifying protein YgfZ